MEEMLYEIREHCCAMNAGRWDYIFSAIKRFSRKPDCVLPDRKQVKHTKKSNLHCIYMLFAGWEVRMVKNCYRGLENTA